MPYLRLTCPELVEGRRCEIAEVLSHTLFGKLRMMSRKSYPPARRVASVASLLVIGSSVSLFGQETKAEVVAADSGWTINGRRPELSHGAEVPAGSKLVGSQTKSHLILDCQRLGLLDYSCSTPGCSFTVCERKGAGVVVQPHGGIFGNLSKWVSSTFSEREEPQKMVTAAARAGGSPNDALLLLEGDTVHWGPALRRVLEGRYCFKLSKLGRKPASKTFKIDWDGSADPEGAVSVPGLAPGGYRLEKAMPGSCAIDPDSSGAWVVIAPTSSYSRLKDEWNATTRWLDQLDKDNATVATVVTTRRTVLAGMAELLEHP